MRFFHDPYEAARSPIATLLTRQRPSSFCTGDGEGGGDRILYIVDYVLVVGSPPSPFPEGFLRWVDSVGDFFFGSTSARLVAVIVDCILYIVDCRLGVWAGIGFVS